MDCISTGIVPPYRPPPSLRPPVPGLAAGQPPARPGSGRGAGGSAAAASRAAAAGGGGEGHAGPQLEEGRHSWPLSGQ